MAEKKVYGPSAPEKTTNGKAQKTNVYTNMQNKGAGLLVTKNKPAAKPRAKVQKVETKSAGVTPVKSKTVPVAPAVKNQEYAKKQSNTSRIQEKKEKLMRKTEKAVSQGNNITAKRLAKRVERKDKRIERKSK